MHTYILYFIGCNVLCHIFNSTIKMKNVSHNLGISAAFWANDSKVK